MPRFVKKGPDGSFQGLDPGKQTSEVSDQRSVSAKEKPQLTKGYRTP
jgi:hypothetical protein